MTTRHKRVGASASLGAACLLLLAIRAPAATPGDPGSPVPSSVPATNQPVAVPQGPSRLQKEVRVTVSTNAPPEPESTGAGSGKDQTFAWESSWAGWEGWNVAVTKKTRLDDPLAGVREWLEATNAPPVFHLEEMKMSGKIGGKFALDGAGFLAAPGLSGFDAGVELRRARVFARGDCILILPVSYHFEVGYIPGEFYIEESFLSFRDLPWIGELKAGQYQVPMGLDVITSSRDIGFMEPAAALQALAPGVNAGLQIGRPVLEQRANWRFGLFTEGLGSDFGEATRDYGRAIVRLTGLPWYRPEGDANAAPQLLHLGVSANVLYSANNALRYRSRPESHLAPYVIDTGDIEADRALVLGAEVAWVSGPLCVQGEYLHSWIRERGGREPGFDGGYVGASWFLTGESRPYDAAESVFTRVVPRHPFDFRGGGWGAWEAAARYSYTDLDSGDVRGGRLGMAMAGVNWYPHGHVRWRFDYGFGRVSGGPSDGDFHVFETRVEVDF